MGRCWAERPCSQVSTLSSCLAQLAPVNRELPCPAVRSAFWVLECVCILPRQRRSPTSLLPTAQLQAPHQRPRLHACRACGGEPCHGRAVCSVRRPQPSVYIRPEELGASGGWEAQWVHNRCMQEWAFGRCEVLQSYIWRAMATHSAPAAVPLNYVGSGDGVWSERLQRRPPKGHPPPAWLASHRFPTTHPPTHPLFPRRWW